MKKRVLATAVVVGATSVALAAPQVGSANDVASVAARPDVWHVLHFTSKEVDDRQIGEFGEPGYREISVDALKNARGRTVGYNSISSRRDNDTGLYTSHLGIALKRGALVAKVKENRELLDDRYVIIRGPIKDGVGRYAGAEGRVRITIDIKDQQGGENADVKIRWR
jgi:uncharacterized protein YdeI (BOF family)